MSAIRCHAKEDNPADETTRVYSVAFHPKNEHMLGSVGGNSVCVLDCGAAVLLLKYLHPLEGGREDFFALAWTILPIPTIFTGSEIAVIAAAGRLGDIKLIDVENKLLYGLLEGHRLSGTDKRCVNALAFSPTQPRWLFSAADDQTIRLWDIGTPSGADYTAQSTCLAVFEEHKKAVAHFDIRGDGRRLISAAGSEGLFIWNIKEKYRSPEEGKEPKKYKTLQILKGRDYFSGSPADCVVWLTDSLIVTKLYEAEQLAVLDVSREHRHLVAILQWPAEFDSGTCTTFIRFTLSPDGSKLLLGTPKGQVLIYDMQYIKKLAKKGKPWKETPDQEFLQPIQILKQEQNNEVVWQVAMSRTGKFIACGTGNNLVCIWERKSDRQTDQEI